MERINTILAAIGIIGLMTVTAQYQHPGGDYFFFRNGGMYRVIVDMESRVLEEQRIANGLTVWPDGRFKTLNGKVRKLKEGEYLDPNGIIFPNYAALRKEMKAHDLAVEQIRLELVNGELMRCTNGTREPVMADVKLNNGSLVTPSGQIRMKSGQSIQMHEGACLDMAGRMYKDKEDFHRKVQQGISTGPELKVKQH